MNKILLFTPILLLFYSCHREETYYEKIDSKTYYSFKAYDTLVEKGSVLVTKCKLKISDSNYQILLKKENSYFILDSDCDIENDSTIIVYAPPFKWDSENGGIQKNGIWFYAEFYKEKNKTGNSIYNVSDSGVNFNVDTIPKKLNIKNLPICEGIYFFEKDSLILVSKEQTEDKFSNLNKNGFYFIPNTGRLFKRIKISSIQ